MKENVEDKMERINTYLFISLVTSRKFKSSLSFNFLTINVMITMPPMLLKDKLR